MSGINYNLDVRVYIICQEPKECECYIIIAMVHILYNVIFKFNPPPFYNRYNNMPPPPIIYITLQSHTSQNPLPLYVTSMSSIQC